MDQLAVNMDKFSGKTDDREIIITRLLDAPQKLVFKAWTDPKHLINWWDRMVLPTLFTKLT